MIFLDLFLGFFKVGLFTFGGGYAAIPLIRETVLDYGWLTEEALAYMIAVSESTPGPIMVNLATYIGSSQAGLLGSAVATLAVILPSFVIILLVMSLLKAVVKNGLVQAVLGALRPCVTGIIVATGLYMTFSGVFLPGVDMRALIVAAVVAAVMLMMRVVKKKRLSPVALILLSALAGMVVY